MYPSIDAIAEFKVLTSNYGAQYGRNGSGTVEVETKSGTKRSMATPMNSCATTCSTPRTSVRSSWRRPDYKKNDFGYTIGGPVYIPGVYNKDKQKTFFFWSQEWRRDMCRADFNMPVPCSAERSGNFTDLCRTGSGLPECRADVQVTISRNNQVPVSHGLPLTIPLIPGAGAPTCTPGRAANHAS